MLFEPTIATKLSGALGGIIASHNAGGPYFRQRATPTNPNSVFQMAVRNAMGVLSTRWVDTLTQDQRDAWATYAANVTVTNRIGHQINIPALAMYNRSNVARLQVGLPLQDTAPIIFSIGSFTEPEFTLDQPNAEVDVTFDVADDWANEDGSAMLVYTSPPQNQSIEYYKGPFRFAGEIAGSLATPPTSPATIPLPFPLAVGQRVFIKVRVSRADGRYSAIFLGQADS